MADRVHKSLLNAKVNLIFYFLSLFFSFFSRKIFLDCLGADFIGLTGTLGNILGYLNLAELGVGTAISVFLYKPIQNQDKEQLKELLSLFGYIYSRIGCVIFIIGFIISLFFPLIFYNSGLGLGIIYFAFYTFLASSLIGYFINYRQILLTADQKNYLVIIYFQSSAIIKVALQIILAYVYKNPYIWVSVEFIFSVFTCIILNRKINKEYPWLKIERNKVLLSKYSHIINSSKQVFVHKFKEVLLSKSDELFVFVFVSLKMVAYYGNYTMITSKITFLFTSVLDGTNAGVGNLVAEGNKSNIMKVFWELMTIRHFVASLLSFSLYYLLEPFVTLWLGEEYVLNHTIIILLTIYIYMANSRGAVDMFGHSYGLYADTWSAWVEILINVSITFIVGFYYGIIGVLLGKIFSVFIIVVFWKPYYLFKTGLKLPVCEYWRGAIIYYLIFVLSFSILYLIESIIPLDITTNWGTLILYGFIIVSIYIVINAFLLYSFAKGAKDLYSRLRDIVKK